MADLVSILIPAHESGAWVAEAIQSALDQSWQEKEVVVVDDGSTDGTADVLRSFGPQIRWERIPHSGANAARNRLLALSRGEWLQYLDADDLLLPDKLERQIAGAGSGTDFVAAPCRNEVGECILGPRGEDPWVSLLRLRLGTTSANLFRRAAIEKVGGWDPTSIPVQDYRLMSELLRVGCVPAMLSEPLCIKRRVNPESVWLRDRKLSRWAVVQLGAKVVRDLEALGGLTDERRDAAGALFTDMVCSFGPASPQGREALALARELGLPNRALLSEAPLRYRVLARTRGITRAIQAEKQRRKARRRAP